MSILLCNIVLCAASCGVVRNGKMNVPAVLVIQSIPFAGLVMAARGGTRDLFAILYIVGVGLLVSLIVWAGDPAGFDQAISAIAEFE